mmetsp:Transcript_4230/g.11511  ORF Transcript_4230/g.11511 Transcript_4230/m.11511 type:complete len:166 (+) Transcript_4230:949-1446(+)
MTSTPEKNKSDTNDEAPMTMGRKDWHPTQTNSFHFATDERHKPGHEHARFVAAHSPLPQEKNPTLIHIIRRPWAAKSGIPQKSDRSIFKPTNGTSRGMNMPGSWRPTLLPWKKRLLTSRQKRQIPTPTNHSWAAQTGIPQNPKNFTFTKAMLGHTPRCRPVLLVK